MIYMLLFINFVLVCLLFVYFYNSLKEKEDDIEELYDVFYECIENNFKKKEKKKTSSKVIDYDRSIF